MTRGWSIRPATPADADLVARIAVDSTLFAPDEMAGFVFEPDSEGDHWLVCEREGTPVGAAYYAREPFSDRIWNLYFLAVLAAHQGDGVGSVLLRHVEQALSHAGPTVARALIVETSGLGRFAPARRFYARHGYRRVGRLPGFYAPGDDKIVFWKDLAPEAG